jgi:hypothetical protein
VRGAEGGLGRAGGAIIGGAEATGDPAVVLLVSYPEDLSTFDSCTASVIGDRVLLTAAHCLDPETHSGYSFGVFTGADASAYETAATLAPQLAPVKEVVLHPDYDREPPFLADIGVAILEEAVSIEPLPFQREALGEDVVGKPARIVGYGQAKYEEPSATRRAATTVVAALGDVDTVSVGDLERRSCIGDSGGPALVEIDGEERIVGVDSYTELSGCLEPAHYRRPDVYTGFLEVYAPAAGGGWGRRGGRGRRLRGWRGRGGRERGRVRGGRRGWGRARLVGRARHRDAGCDRGREEAAGPGGWSWFQNPSRAARIARPSENLRSEYSRI